MKLNNYLFNVPLLGFILMLNIATQAQSQSSDDYFQQEVHYTIEVTLDDVGHFLNGTIAIDYTNNSPDALSEIYFHLWPNAYKNNDTEFAKQQFENGDTKFMFAPEKDRGSIDQLNFKINGNEIKWEYDEQHIDIVRLALPQPLQSGSTITIETPFRVKIPNSFSRLGHVETSYQMTQWYPKPAVYDANGWHPMPYLNQGEFYSEYGSFDVSITLPKNYVVGATGVLETKEEIAFLQQRIEETNSKIKDGTISNEQSFPTSSKETKTIRYKAENVHDFAWFADKRFYVQKSELELASGRKIDTWSMFTYQEAELWLKATDYINRAVKYYSERVGEYPYPQATAVQSALSAGAGMEYPMITVIGMSEEAMTLDAVITHEVGHNWFYGILGSNERDYTWMDEGFNSFYDNAYLNKYHNATQNLEGMGLGPFALLFSEDERKQDLGYAAYLFQQRRGEIVPPSSNARQMTSLNYGILGYYYPAFLFRYVEAYLGQDEFDRVMQVYFKEWTFKHPQPKDVKAIFERETGKDFDWLFDEIFGTQKKLDYKMKAAIEKADAVQLTIVNTGEIKAPFSVSSLREGVILETVWYDGFLGTKTISFPTAAEGYRIDALGLMPEVNRRNNYIKSNGIFKKIEKLQIKLIGGLETGERSKLYFAPSLDYNLQDGLMLGASFYNGFVPNQKLGYNIRPLYGLGSDNLVGTGSLNYTLYPKMAKFKRIKVGVEVKSLTFDDDDVYEYEARFLRVLPYAELQFKASPTSPTTTYVNIRGGYIQEEFTQFNSMGDYSGLGTADRMFYELSYELKNRRVMYPFSLKAALVGHNYEKSGTAQSDVRLMLEGKYKLNYSQSKKKSADLRLFFGQFLANSDTEFGRFPFNITGDARTDYFYNDRFLGRGSVDGLGTSQYNQTQGGFKTPLETAYRIGMSNSTLFAVNLTLDAPMSWLPVKAFIDLAYFEDTRPTVAEFQTYYASGLQYVTANGAFELSLPLFASDELGNAYFVQDFWQRFSFSVNVLDFDLESFLQGF